VHNEQSSGPGVYNKVTLIQFQVETHQIFPSSFLSSSFLYKALNLSLSLPKRLLRFFFFCSFVALLAGEDVALDVMVVPVAAGPGVVLAGVLLVAISFAGVAGAFGSSDPGLKSWFSAVAAVVEGASVVVSFAGVTAS